jgi:hypothetical protein
MLRIDLDPGTSWKNAEFIGDQRLDLEGNWPRNRRPLAISHIVGNVATAILPLSRPYQSLWNSSVSVVTRL